MRTVTICGLGLIGGSFALALRKAGYDGAILGISSQRSIDAALQLGIIDRGATPQDGLPEADLIYLAQPISQILDFLPLVAQHKNSHSLVTDAGSTKAIIMRRALELMPPESVLGGHPMAGKEVRGVEAAEAGLFRNRSYILVPGSSDTLQHPVAISLIEMIRRFQAQVLFMDAYQHDSTISLTSHLCQIVSTALACTVADSLTSTDIRTAGPALRDMTRVALSSYDLWRDIIDTNRELIDQSVESLISHLQDIRNQLGKPAMADVFAKGAALAAAVRKDT